MKEIIEKLSADLKALEEFKPQTHNTAVARAQLKSAIEYLTGDLPKEEKPDAGGTPAVPGQTEPAGTPTE